MVTHLSMQNPGFPVTDVYSQGNVKNEDIEWERSKTRTSKNRKEQVAQSGLGR